MMIRIGRCCLISTNINISPQSISFLFLFSSLNFHYCHYLLSHLFMLTMSLPTLESSHTRQGFASELCITVSAATIGDEEAQGIPAQLLKHRNHFLKCRMLYWEPDWLVSGCSVSNLLNLDANDSLLDITLAYFRFTSDNLGIEGANSWIQFQGRLFPYSVDLSAGPSDSDDEHNAILPHHWCLYKGK
jgi:hypothetical protein